MATQVAELPIEGGLDGLPFIVRHVDDGEEPFFEFEMSADDQYGRDTTYCSYVTPEQALALARFIERCVPACPTCRGEESDGPV